MAGLKALEDFQMAGLTAMEEFICMLQRCRKERNLGLAKLLHAHACNMGWDAHRAIGNYMVPVMVECANLASAHHAFNQLVHRNHHSWTSLISAYVKQGLPFQALSLYHIMQTESTQASLLTHLALLKACATLKDVAQGRALHSEIAQLGYDTDLHVCNSLIDMYAKCGAFSEALQVFEQLPARDVVSWSTLIGGYVEHGHGDEALKCFAEMEMEGVSPNAFTFVCTLKACGITRAVDKGLLLHAEIGKQGLETNVYVGSALVDMYVKWGSLSEAREVFDKLPVRNAVSWTALIAGYAEYGRGHEALDLFEQMQLEGVSPTFVTFVSLIKACSSTCNIVKGREIHKMVTEGGLFGHISVGNSLIDMYAKVNSLSEAQEVFDKLPARNAVTWSSLIAGYAEYGHVQETLKCFEEMQLDGILPNAVTFSSILKVCGNAGALEKGKEIHMVIVQKGFESDLFIGISLVDMYAKCGSFLEAEDVFDKLPVRDVVEWTALIAGYAGHGCGQEALLCFEQMQLGGVIPNVVTFLCILKACGIIGAIEKGREIYSKVRKTQLTRETTLSNAFIDMFGKCGSVLEAREVFLNLSGKNVVSWNSIIGAYAEGGRSLEALNFYEGMQLEGLSPDIITFIYILKACGNIGAIDKGREIHTQVIQKNSEQDLSIGNILVDMYAKCGSTSEAREIFDKMPVKTVVSWSAMISGYGMNNEGLHALQCFENMLEQGVKPDAVTFTCILIACSRASLVLKGQEYFKVMREGFGIVPTIDHYTCLIDLLSRSGHLYEAEKFLQSVPYSFSMEMWMALLSACKTYGEAELGLRCFDQLVKMKPDNAAAYVLMSNVYTNAGRRKDSYLLEELRKHSGAKKTPASALIEVNKKVYEFMVGDTQSKEISAMLDILSSRMEEEEYMPNLDQGLRPVSDEGKDAALCEHAEKLAVAFGLLSTPPGQVLRMSKNMRMCNNCHNATKVISNIERREIIVRDIYCIHRFKDGLCSCTFPT